jgi:two-component sensor histidine kinase
MDTRRLEISMQENENLIKELYYKSRRNMQLISGIINEKLSRLNDTEKGEALKDYETKISAMSRVHQLIYESGNFTEISLPKYIDDIVEMIYQAKHISEANVKFEKVMDDIIVHMNTAMPLGMVINELVTNSFNCGFKAGCKGCINLNIFQEGSKLYLDYRDNGRGLPSMFNLDSLTTFGLKLVSEIVDQQLAGTVMFESRKGFHCHIIVDTKIH